MAGAEQRDDEHADADRAFDVVFASRLASSALPNSPCGRKASTSASSANVRTIEYCVQQSFPTVGRYAAENMKHEPVQQGAGSGPEQRAHAADDDDDERVEEPLSVLELGDVALRRAHDGIRSRRVPAPTTNAIAKTTWMLMPSADVI